MKSQRAYRTLRPAVLVLFLASAGCRQVFGLEEPEEDGSSGTGGDACLMDPKPVVPLTDVQTQVTLGCENDYVIDADTTVFDGATLTILPGTTVRAKPNVRLIVAPGGRLVADGTAARPIVFTWEGDKVWGGIELRGKAPGSGAVCTNNYPFKFATNPTAEDDSGVLRYVRIEHAGSQSTACTGALVLLGVGHKTELDEIDIPFSDSDGLSIAGGTPWLRHVVVTDPDDDGIDLENDAHAKIQHYVYRGEATVMCDDLSRCPNAIDADAAEIEARNATLCGYMTKDPELNVAILSSGGAKVTIQRSIALDHSAMLDTEGTGKALIETSVFAHGLAAGLSEIGPGDDLGFDENQFAAPAHQNASIPTAPIQCFGEVNLTPTSDPGDPGNPAADDFFDETATYTGALSSTDPWMDWISIPP